MNFKYYIIQFNIIFLTISLGVLTACGSKNSENSNSLSNTDDAHLEAPAINNSKGLLVKFKGNISFTEQQSILKNTGLTEVQDYSFAPGLIYSEAASSASIADIIVKLKSNENVIYAEPDYNIYVNEISSENHDIVSNKIAQRNLEIVEANESTTSNFNSIVAILDTGIDISHKDLNQNMWVNIKEIPLNKIDDDHNGWVDDIYGWNFEGNHNNPLDDNNHGTHVAGIITGHFDSKTSPVVKDIKLVTLKVLNKDGQGKISAVLGAFDYIVKNNIPISNNSWTTDEDSLALKDAIQQLSKHNHLLIVAAGNNSANIDDTPIYPASYSFSNLLTISALDESGKLADFANFGNKSVHLGAFGSAISSTSMNNSYTTLSGTSMASAFVSGIAVRVLNKYSQFKAQDIKNWLFSNAQQDETLKDFTTTSSKLDNLEDILALISPEDVIIDDPTLPPLDNSENNPPPADNGSPITDGPASDALTTPILSADITSISVGSTLQLSIENSTPPLSWTNENPETGTIDETGLFSALAAGSTNVYFTDATNQVSNKITITTTQLSILPEDLNQLAIPQRITINATGGSAPYDWSISDSTIANININPDNNAELELVPLKTGFVSLTLTDSLGNSTIVENIEINIPQLAVTPSAMVLNMGQSIQLTTLGGSSPYTFESQNNAIASVDLAGFITAISAGSTNISITDAEGQVSIVSIIVNPNISVNAVRNILAINDTQKINADGAIGSVSWASSDSSILNVDASGIASAHKPGLVKINAMDELGRIGSLLMEVRQVRISSNIFKLTAGDPAIQLAATGGATPYSWSVDNNSIATITTEGLLSTVLPGILSVNVTDADGFNANLNITVDPAPLSSNLNSLVLALNDSAQLIATGGDGNYSWMSQNETIITVSASGLVETVALGNTNIELTDNSGQSKIISVSVQNIGFLFDATDILITHPGLQITATGGTEPYNWSVNNVDIADIDSNGLLTPVLPGVVTVSVIDANSITASIDITISVETLTISPSSVIMDINKTLTFKASGGDNNYLWTSSDSNILAIDDNGTAQSLLAGTTSIILSDGTDQSATANVEIRELTISAPGTSITVGDPAMQLAVFGGKAPYTWNSSNNLIASISNNGLVTPLARGSVNITATDTDGITATTTISINDAALAVNTNNLILSPNETYAVIAQGGDGNYTWSSLNAAVATVNSTGSITALSAGTSTITLKDGIGRTINIYVEVRSISILADNTNLTLGQSAIQLNAFGGVAPYTWVSSNSTILVVDQAGTLLALNPGTATITVTDNDGFSANLNFTVNDALNVNQSNATLAIGSSLTIIANGGSGNYSWSSNNTAIASVNANGLVNALATGNANITVTDDNGQSVQVSIVVSSFNISASKTTLMLTDPALQIEASGGALPYTWSVDDNTVASINSSGQLNPLSTGTVVVTVTDANNNTGTISITINVKPLSINTTNVLLGMNDSFQLTASGGDNNFIWTTNNASIATVDNSGKIQAVNSGSTIITVTDGAGQSVSIDVEVRKLIINTTSTTVYLGNSAILTASGGAAPYDWSSSDNTIASVNSSGLLSANSIGLATITVTDNDGFTATVSINVNVTAMTIDKVSAILGISQSLQLNVNGGDGNYTWSSSNSSVANVSNSGLVTANSVGISVITVVDGLGNSQSTAIEVRRVSLTSTKNNMTVGQASLQINASGGNAPYFWTSSNNAIATVNTNGQVTAIDSGNVIISATDMDGFSGTISLNIDLPTLTLNQADTLLAVGQNLQLSANGGDGNYTWTSSNPAIAQVNSSGYVTAQSSGSTTILLSDASGNSRSITLSVFQITLSSSTNTLTVGGTALQLTATGGTAPYSWASNNDAIASVNSNGQVTAISAGNVQITATDVNGFSANLALSVSNPAMTIEQENYLISINDTVQLNVSGGSASYTWSSSDNTIASVNSTGLVTALKEGIVTITVTDELNSKITTTIEIRNVSIDVSSTNLTLGGPGLQANVSGGIAPYTWSSNNASIASVNNNGQISPVSAGNATITVTDADGFSSNVNISVIVLPLSINQPSALLAIGDTMQLSADGGDFSYNWFSNDASIAGVDNNGLLTAIAPGNVTITVSDGLGTTLSVTIEVRQVSINASTTSMVVGGSTLILTASGGQAPYNWISSNNSIATVNSNGSVTAISSGNILITATDSAGFSDSINISVTVPSMTISQSNALLGIGSTLNLAANGGDGNYSWSSSNSNVASVSSSGLVTANNRGNVTISVSDGLGTTRTANIEVREVTLSAASNSITVGDPALQINASGGNTPYNWRSSNTSVATINANGQLTAIASGSVVITATDSDGFSGSINITVSVPTMTISQRNALLGIGDTLNLDANGGDGNYSWSSSNSNVASVSSSGLVTANNRGNVTISVSDGFGTTRTANIEVREVTLSAASNSITVGDPALQINASGGNTPYNWRSSNTSVATINSNGQLTAIASGSVVITATDSDGFSGSISITVNAAPIIGGGGDGGGGMGGGGH